ncbi:hypothetical protein KAR91_37710 [Candidatus Pacearchaeota archaeon]|nr:hypothetical protein [Candidatus Pacearchaeota archaeon]
MQKSNIPWPEAAWWFVRHGIGNAMYLWRHCGMRFWTAIDFSWSLANTTLEEYQGTSPVAGPEECRIQEKPK